MTLKKFKKKFKLVNLRVKKIAWKIMTPGAMIKIIEKEVLKWKSLSIKDSKISIKN